MKYALLIGTVLSFLFVVRTADLDLSNIDINDLKSQLPGELANTNFTMDDVNNLLKDKCIKVAGEEEGQKAFEEIGAASMKLAECANSIVNYTAIQEEINTASPDGELDAVFNKYCLRKPEAIQCIETFNSKLTPCLDKEERDNQEIFLRIIRSLLDFICYKGGDQIALFIAEKGPECLSAHSEGIQNCINNTFSGYLPDKGIGNITSLPKFVMGPKQCNDMQHLESCIVKKLETCDEITPANIVESMFRFIKNETICRSIPNTDKQVAGNAGDAVHPVMIELNALLLALFITMLTYFNRETII